MGLVTPRTTETNGETIARARLEAGLRSGPPTASSVKAASMKIDSDTTRRRPLGCATGEAASARRRGDEHPLEDVELLEALATPDRDAAEGVLGHHHRHRRLGLEPGAQAVQQGATAREHDPLVHDVRHALRLGAG